MKYMGSKRRLAKYIAPIIQRYIDSTNAKTYIEPFVGGANMIEHIKCENRCGSDSHKYLIAMLRAIQDGWEPPVAISEREYKNIRERPDCFAEHLSGFVGFGCSYSGKWFGGYARGNNSNGKPRNYCDESRRNILAQSPKIADVSFTCHTYKNWLPTNCVIYCDPPYANTTKYKSGDFGHAEFWQWCREMAKNNVVLVSEYSAPDDIECIWSKEIVSSLTQNTGAKKGVEKLFLVK